MISGSRQFADKTSSRQFVAQTDWQQQQQHQRRSPSSTANETNTQTLRSSRRQSSGDRYSHSIINQNNNYNYNNSSRDSNSHVVNNANRNAITQLANNRASNNNNNDYGDNDADDNSDDNEQRCVADGHQRRRRSYSRPPGAHSPNQFADESQLELGEQLRDEYLSRYKWRDAAQMLTDERELSPTMRAKQRNATVDNAYILRTLASKTNIPTSSHPLTSSSSLNSSKQQQRKRFFKSNNSNNAFNVEQENYNTTAVNDDDDTDDDDDDLRSDVELEPELAARVAAADDASQLGTASNFGYSMLSSFRLRNRRPLSVLSAASSSARKSLASAGRAPAANSRIALGPISAQHFVTNSKRRRQANELILSTLEARRRAFALARADAAGSYLGDATSSSPQPQLQPQQAADNAAASAAQVAAANARSVSPIVAAANAQQLSSVQKSLTQRQLNSPTKLSANNLQVKQQQQQQQQQLFAELDQNSSELRSSSPSESLATSSSGSQFTQLSDGAATPVPRPRATKVGNTPTPTPTFSSPQSKQQKLQATTTATMHQQQQQEPVNEQQTMQQKQQQQQQQQQQRPQEHRTSIGGSFRKGALRRDSIRRLRLSRQQQQQQQVVAKSTSNDEQQKQQSNFNNRQLDEADDSLRRTQGFSERARSVDANAGRASHSLATGEALKVEHKQRSFVERRSASASSMAELRQQANKQSVEQQAKSFDDFDAQLDDTKRRLNKIQDLLRDLQVEKEAAASEFAEQRRATLARIEQTEKALLADIESIDKQTCKLLRSAHEQQRKQQQQQQQSLDKRRQDNEQSDELTSRRKLQPQVYVPTRKIHEIDVKRPTLPQQPQQQQQQQLQRQQQEEEQQQKQEQQQQQQQSQRRRPTSIEGIAKPSATRDSLPKFEANAGDEFRKRVEQLRNLARANVNAEKTPSQLAEDGKSSERSAHAFRRTNSAHLTRPLSTNWTANASSIDNSVSNSGVAPLSRPLATPLARPHELQGQQQHHAPQVQQQSSPSFQTATDIASWRQMASMQPTTSSSPVKLVVREKAAPEMNCASIVEHSNVSATNASNTRRQVFAMPQALESQSSSNDDSAIASSSSASYTRPRVASPIDLISARALSPPVGFKSATDAARLNQTRPTPMPLKTPVAPQAPKTNQLQHQPQQQSPKRVHFSERTIVRSFESLTSLESDTEQDNDVESTNGGRLSAESPDLNRDAGAAIYAVRDEFPLAASNTGLPTAASATTRLVMTNEQVNRQPASTLPPPMHQQQQQHKQQQAPQVSQTFNLANLSQARNSNSNNDDDDDDDFDYALQLRQAASRRALVAGYAPATTQLRLPPPPPPPQMPVNQYARAMAAQQSAYQARNQMLPQSQIQNQSQSQQYRQQAFVAPIPSQYTQATTLTQQRQGQQIQQQMQRPTMSSSLSRLRRTLNIPTNRPMTRDELLAYQTEV